VSKIDKNLAPIAGTLSRRSSLGRGDSRSAGSIARSIDYLFPAGSRIAPLKLVSATNERESSESTCSREHREHDDRSYCAGGRIHLHPSGESAKLHRVKGKKSRM